MRQIVTCTGHGGTGSSFITDFFKEFENVKSTGNFEFTLSYNTYVRKCEWGILLCSGEPERGYARSLEGIKWGTLRERRGQQPDGTGNFLRKEGRIALQSGRQRVCYGRLAAG